MPTPTAQLRGADLERRIERFLTLHGYACRRNAVVEGRSGARHEIDVLAGKEDGVTGYRLAVECKAWNHPVDKEVVAKLAYVVADLGLHKGIVVALCGSSLGAEQAARQLGIELWGPADLESRLGQLALAEVASGPAPRLGQALAQRCPPETAHRLIAGERRGWFGRRREQVESFDLAWVPHHVVTIATTEPDVRFGRRGALSAAWRWNLYEAVTGTFMDGLSVAPTAVEADLTLTFSQAVPAGKVVAAIRRVADRRDDAVNAAARDRHVGRLETLGIPGEAVSITVEGTELLYCPFHLAVLTRKGQARVVAVDAHRSALSPAMSAVLTAAIGSVRRELRPRPPAGL